LKKRLVVIGNGMAGVRTIEELLVIAPDKYEITVFGSESYGNYNRILLSAVLSGEKKIDEIFINDYQWYEHHGITLHTGESKTVVRIEKENKIVYAQDGTVANYDCLLIATGSKANIPSILGNHLEGVISFRSIVDVKKMLAYTHSHVNAVVLGGGVLGLEAANGLTKQGMKVTVVHNNDILLNRQLDKPAAQLLQSELEQKGLVFKMSARPKQLLGNHQEHIESIQFEDGSELACDLLVMAVGVHPNITLAEQSGLYCERGIIVNDCLQTQDPAIYAVGECIEYRGETFGLVAPLFEQAKVCANHLAEQCSTAYISLPTATKLKITGIQLFSAGHFLSGHEFENLYFSDTALKVYKKLVIQNNKLVGIVLYGDTSDASWYMELLEQSTNIARIRDCLIFGKTDIA